MPLPANRPPTPPIDDDLDDLPPLDGTADDDPEPEYTDLLDDDGAFQDGDPLDDSTGESEPLGEDRELEPEEEEGWLEGSEEADGLDLGGQELVDFGGEATAPGDWDEAGLGDEDFGLGGSGEERGELDSGEEGPEGELEAIDEQQLPALDMDDEGEVDERDLLEPGFALASIPWAVRPWVPAGAPVHLGPKRAVVCAGQGVVAAGPGLVRVDLEGATEALGADGLEGEACRLAARGGHFAVVTRDGELFLSNDGGRSFQVNGGWRARSGEGADARLTDVRVAGGRLWALTQRGELLTADLGGDGWEGPVVKGFVAGLADADGNGLVAFGEAMAPAPAAGLYGVPAPASASGTAVARFDAKGDVWVCVTPEGLVERKIGEDPWERIGGVEGAGAALVLDSAGALLVATYSANENATWLVHVDVEGQATLVAELGARDAQQADDDEERKVRLDLDARPYALARDDAHGVVWVVGGFGVVAFEPPARGAVPGVTAAARNPHVA